jgi:excisionase family DNA binding protein
VHTLKDASRLLNVNYATLASYYRQGKLPGTKLGTYVLVNLDDVKAAIVDYKPKPQHRMA